MKMTYTMTPEVMTDFEQFLRRQQAISPKARLLSGLLGAACVLNSGWILYKDGFSLGAAGFVLAGTLLLLMAVRKPKETASYRSALTGRKIGMTIDDNGVQMTVNGKLTGSARWKKVHAAFETERCYYIETGINAYFIVDKKAADPSLKKLLQTKTKASVIEA